MRLKARTNFQYEEKAYKAEDVLDVPDRDAVDLINRDKAMIWNLEDYAHRSKNVEDIEVEPLPDVPPVTISPTSDDMASGVGAGSFTVTMTGPGVSGTWIVDKDASATWLTYVPTAPQSADGTVNYNVTANTGAERVAHFYTNGKTFTITQAGSGATTMARRRHP